MTPEMIKVKAKGVWEGGARTAVQIPQHRTFGTDMPAFMGGTDQDPCPMEYLLGSLIGCELTTMVGVARQMGFQFQGAEVTVEGDIDPRGMQMAPGIKPYFQEVRQLVRVQTPESQQRLDQISQEVERRCPSFNLLKDAGVQPFITWEAVQ